MSIRSLTFYITGQNVKVKSDHLPLKLLTKYPILWYPDPNKDYTLFTDVYQNTYGEIS